MAITKLQDLSIATFFRNKKVVTQKHNQLKTK